MWTSVTGRQQFSANGRSPSLVNIAFFLALSLLASSVRLLGGLSWQSSYPFWSFLFKMTAMLQIPRVFSRASCLRRTKAVQCPHPGPKIGDKSQQIPRYSPLCSRGHPPPPGMAADKCISQSIFVRPGGLRAPNLAGSTLGRGECFLLPERWPVEYMNIFEML